MIFFLVFFCGKRFLNSRRIFPQNLKRLQDKMKGKQKNGEFQIFRIFFSQFRNESWFGHMGVRYLLDKKVTSANFVYDMNHNENRSGLSMFGGVQRALK